MPGTLTGFSRRSHRLLLVTTASVALILIALTSPGAAHAGSLSLSRDPQPIPKWVFAVSGGGVMAMSFLFSALVTDTAVIHALRNRQVRPAIGAGVWPSVARVMGVLGLLMVVTLGFVGPSQPLANPAVLLVWVGWWTGFTMSTYLLGNTWPWVNPWQTIVEALPTLDRSYPRRIGRWPAVAGLMVLVFLEVVTPVVDQPALLSTVVIGYSAITIGGSMVFGPDDWFRYVDPIAGVFRYYGKLAPVQWENGRPVIRAPTVTLTNQGTLGGVDDVAFVITLLWVTTFDGLVSTPLGTNPIAWFVGIGVPPVLSYVIVLIAGFLVFFVAFRGTASGIRLSANTYVSTPSILGRFAPTLLPIAAAYHFAHFIAYLLELTPALMTALRHPLSAQATIPVVSLPSWFGFFELSVVVIGHVIAVWTAHSIAFELFTGRVQPIRSQYPLALLMVAYTITSLWIVIQPVGQPPFL